MTKKHRVAEYDLSTSPDSYVADTLYIPQGSRILGTYAQGGCPYLVVLEPFDDADPYGHKIPKACVEYWVTTGYSSEAHVPNWASPGALSYVGCAVEASFQGNTLEYSHWHVFVVEEDDIVCYPPSVRKPWEEPV